MNLKGSKVSRLLKEGLPCYRRLSSTVRVTSFRPAARFLMNLFRNQLVLVRGEVVYVGSDCGAPAHPSRIERSEVVIVEPAIATELCLGCTVEGIEAYPQAVSMGSLHERSEPVHFRRCPFPRVGLAARFDHLPRIVPPAPVVGSLSWVQVFGRGRRILVFCVNGAKNQHAIAGLQLIVEHGLLFVGFPRQHQDRLYVERLDICIAGSFDCCREPGLVLAQQGQYRRQMLRLVVFKVEVERDEGPIAMVTFSESLFYDGADALEKILIHG